MKWSGILQGKAKKKQAPDGHPRVADDCHMLSPRLTSAARAREPHQTDGRRGERLDTPPPRAPRRAEQNAKLRRHHRPQQQNLPLGHQGRRSPGERLSLRENLSVRTRRHHQGISKNDTGAGLTGRRLLPAPPLGRIAGHSKAGGHRTMLEIKKKRRRWNSDSSNARYEKAGMLAQIQSDLNKSQLAHFEATDSALEELIFGKHSVEAIPRPL